ncbi:MAG: adenylosuccinate synthase [Aigarchaeota archaeon]|nr:adenylosuccinate synthase [Aigarchaeota archaeon]MCX8193111.1 adenylosuccinate synthase [Nitrososphaeria archaeon]MDW7986734.1 adenylosuccinate synthase [Nitrososphaerota archaeon]
MPGTVVVGLQWGDEGKGKISYLLSREAEYVVRFQGGANAGHTVVVDDKELRFNMLPAGAASGARPCIASGTVVDLNEVMEEVQLLKSIGVNVSPLISRNANIVLPIHRELDSMIEGMRSGEALGTTGRGIGPAYSDKALRIGIRIEDLLHREILENKVKFLEKAHGLKITGIDELAKLAENFIENICSLEIILNDLLDNGVNVIFEGAQGTLLDIDHGTYPYVTSSNTTVGAVLTSCGIGPRKISEVVGVMKAYTTRVGAGVFPTELKDESGVILRERGREYGTTTGRPRRVGWLDIPLTRYCIKINDVDWIALTKLDVLSGFDKLKICVEYELDGETVKLTSPSVRLLERVKPIYIELDGWPKLSKKDWEEISTKGWDSLPDNAREYVETIEELLGKPIKIVSIGARVGMEVVK